MLDWVVLRTNARQESRAIDHPQEQGIRVYCPQVAKYDVSK